MLRNFMVKVFTKYFRVINMLMALPGLSNWKYNRESFPDLNGKYCFSWVLPCLTSETVWEI